MVSGVHLMLAHEMPDIADLAHVELSKEGLGMSDERSTSAQDVPLQGIDTSGARGLRHSQEAPRQGTEFDNFFNNTPKTLLKLGIYEEVAVRPPPIVYMLASYACASMLVCVALA